MAKTYSVLLTQTVIEEAWVYVEAESKQDAMQKAIDLAINGNRDIQFYSVDCVDGVEAVNATEVA